MSLIDASSPSLYYCLFIWGQLDYRRHGKGSRTVCLSILQTIHSSCLALVKIVAYPMAGHIKPTNKKTS